MKNNTERVYAYAWELEDGSLCCWAQPSIAVLKKDGHKPSPGAKAVRVELVKCTPSKRKGNYILDSLSCKATICTSSIGKHSALSKEINGS